MLWVTQHPFAREVDRRVDSDLHVEAILLKGRTGHHIRGRQRAAGNPRDTRPLDIQIGTKSAGEPSDAEPKV
jgi:hypothetical protein